MKIIERFIDVRENGRDAQLANNLKNCPFNEPTKKKRRTSIKFHLRAWKNCLTLKVLENPWRIISITANLSTLVPDPWIHGQQNKLIRVICNRNFERTQKQFVKAKSSRSKVNWRNNWNAMQTMKQEKKDKEKRQKCTQAMEANDKKIWKMKKIKKNEIPVSWDFNFDLLWQIPELEPTVVRPFRNQHRKRKYFSALKIRSSWHVGT